MQKAVQHSRDCGCIAQQFSPVFDWAIRRQQCTGTLVTSHDDFEQIFGRGVGQLAHAEIVDDEQWHTTYRFHELFARAIGDGIGQIIEQDMRFSIHHAVVLLNGRVTDGLGQMTLAGAARARNIVPMCRSSSRFTTRGTPYMGRAYAYAERQNSREASTSFAIYPMGALAVSLRG